MNQELLDQYGPFCACLFVEGPAYFGFLHPGAEKTPAAFEAVGRACAEPSASTYAPRLLAGEPNWRPHLIGAIATLIAPSDHMIDALWQAIDGGSWTAPQLIAIASLVDPDFRAKAFERLDRNGQVQPPQGLNHLERHTATGPGSADTRAQKNFTCLLALVRTDDPAKTVDHEKTIMQWREADAFFEDWGDFTLKWLEEITRYRN